MRQIDDSVDDGAASASASASAAVCAAAVAAGNGCACDVKGASLATVAVCKQVESVVAAAGPRRTSWPSDRMWSDQTGT